VLLLLLLLVLLFVVDAHHGAVAEVLLEKEAASSEIARDVDAPAAAVVAKPGLQQCGVLWCRAGADRNSQELNQDGLSPSFCHEAYAAPSPARPAIIELDQQ